MATLPCYYNVMWSIQKWVGACSMRKGLDGCSVGCNAEKRSDFTTRHVKLNLAMSESIHFCLGLVSS